MSFPNPRDDKPDNRILTGALIVLFVLANAVALYSCALQVG